MYISHKFSKRETKYSTIEKECLAILWAVHLDTISWAWNSPSAQTTPLCSGSTA
ncbi:MAG: RNase H-like domain-containing protein [Aeromonas sp.]